MTNSTALKPAAAASLALWHEMVSLQDMGRLPTILNDAAVFRSPMAFKPYVSAAAVNLILNTVMKVFTQFEYHRTLVAEDGLNVVLEFSAMVGDKSLKGIDMIRFDEAGLIVDFEVMVRPLNGLQALGAEMGARLAAYLPAYKESKAS
ncbi:MAG: polyketide cyclase [Leptothrix sp. (in: Bacteria)]|nr:polyketide cyclase [Leptothrix sp. (in: b-proteobacteria)]